MTAQSRDRTKVFISYSHRDEEWLQRLRVHLKPLEREHRIEIWDDTKIKPGSKWRDDIKQALAATKVAVLLVSADFLASDFIATDDLPPLLHAAEKEGAVILPLILSPSRFSKTTSLTQFQAVNDPSRPLIGMPRSEQESVLVRMTEAVEASLNHSPNITRGQLHKGEAISSSEFGEPERSTIDPHSERESGTTNENRRIRLSKIHPIIWMAVIGGIVALITVYWRILKPALTDPVEIGTPAEPKPPDSNLQGDNLVVMITCKMGGDDSRVGGGIIVGAQSDRVYIVTTNHLVRQAGQEANDIRVRFRWLPGESVEANLLSDVERRLDLAVLSVSGSRSLMDRANKLPFNKLSASKAVARGDKVYTIGHPLGRPWDSSIDPDKVVNSRAGLIEFQSNFIYPGHSGGALVNEQGEFVGMITADAPPNAMAIKIDDVLETLKSWGYSIGTPH